MHATEPSSAHPSEARPANDSSPILVIEAWPDPRVEADPRSHRTASTETLLWWTPTLGPTATLMAHRFASALEHQNRLQITTEDLARTFGLGHASGRALAAIARLERFGVATCHGNAVYVRTTLPSLSRRHLDQLPDYLRRLYELRHP